MCLSFLPGSAVLHTAENNHFSMERGRCHCYQACCGYANYGELNWPSQMLTLVPFSFHVALSSFVLTVIISLGNRKLHLLWASFFCLDQAGSYNAQSEFSVAVSVFWLAEHNLFFFNNLSEEKNLIEREDRWALTCVSFQTL